MGIGNVGAVFRFEWRRSLTPTRIAWWTVLTLFPLFIVILIRSTEHVDDIPREPWIGFLFVLVPMVVSMLGMFLWTTPAVSAELERKSWIYLAVRPHGSTAVVLGKYLAAVTWVLPAALLGLTLALWFAPTENKWRTWCALARLASLSCPAYGAVYLVIGALLPKRAMVISVMYTLLFELVVSLVPAVVNKLTVQFRLRALLVDWAAIPLAEGPVLATTLVGNSPPRVHVGVIGVYTLSLLIAAIVLVRWREYSIAEEAD